MKHYLDKYSSRIRLIQERPSFDLGIVVVIPSCNEPHIDHALSALYNCLLPPCAVEVIVVVNASEVADEEVIARNAETIRVCELWKSQHDSPQFRIHIIEGYALPRRKAGVGLARKIGMDEAVRRLHDVGNSSGIIASFDADCTCTHNYFTALHDHFASHSRTPGCAIRFAFPTFGTDHDPKNYMGAAYYELHLRYCNQALRATGYPNAFHVLGAAVAVRASAYVKQGGMETRIADADFYFIQKIIALGHFTEVNTCTVIPSPRVSPGTSKVLGKAFQDYLRSKRRGFYTYNIQAYRYLKVFFKHIPEFYITAPKLEHLGGDLPYIVIDFLSAYFFEERIAEIRQNSRGYNSFERRFYLWFNATMVQKFLDFVKDNAHPNMRVERAALDLLIDGRYADVAEIKSLAELLKAYREIEIAARRKQLRLL